MPTTTFSVVNGTTAPSVASSASSSAVPDHLTLAVLGCGTMGIAILTGVLNALAELDAPRPLQVVASSASVSSMSALYSSHAAVHVSSSAAAPDELPERLPTHFLACVRRPEAAKRVRAALWSHSSVVKVVVDDNVGAVHQAGVVLLACQASEVPALLAAPGMARALSGKLLVSICAGVTAEQISDCLYGDSSALTAPAAAAAAASAASREPLANGDRPGHSHGHSDGRCLIVRAIPNAASLVGESMTVVDTTTASGQPLPADAAALVTWIFRRIGSVVHHPSLAAAAAKATTAAASAGTVLARASAAPSRVAAGSAAACTALATAGPAFFALVLEAAVDGAVAMGLPRAEAQLLAAQSMRGAAGLVLRNGEHPALLRDRIGIPGGCAMQGLLALEEGGVRSTVARAVREAAAVAALEGKEY